MVNVMCNYVTNKYTKSINNIYIYIYKEEDMVDFSIYVHNKNYIYIYQITKYF